MQAQQPATKRIGSNEAIALAKNNLQYEVNNQQLNKGRAQINSATALPKTGVFVENEDFRPSDNVGILKIGVSQSIVWPGLYKAQKNMYSEQLQYHNLGAAAIEAQLKKEVRSVYYQLWYLQDKQRLYQRLDSIYRSQSAAAILKVKTGESPGLDSIAANVRMRELQALMLQVGSEMQIQQQSLMQLLNTKDVLLPEQVPLQKLNLPVVINEGMHPVLALEAQNINIANAEISVVKNENKGRLRVQVMNISGEVVKEVQFDKPFAGSLQTRLSLGSLAPAMYIIRAGIGEWSQVTRVMKQ